ncbi:unnamed protein product [Spirodela intermedia]|uniref:WIT1/2 N-terminal helical bundle domain-containing protein n=1 Tax=Spirodela intermedia TaxID=51605 RepID=A0A7I8LEP4_SPIIN|nr:unnamed protein product [Spirodela intermedia]
MAAEDDHHDFCSIKDMLASGDRISEIGNTVEVLTKIELEVAYCSEKVLNLDILLMNVASQLTDYEALEVEAAFIPPDKVEKAFEFDMLSGILDSELEELDSFMRYLQAEIMDARRRLQPSGHPEAQVGEKLRDAEESLKQSQEQVTEIRTHSTKFERLLALRGKEPGNGEGEGFSDNGHVSLMGDKWKMHTVGQQRHVLQMLEKSLARELDLEKRLSEARYEEEVLRLKLGLVEKEASCAEESMADILERLFEADNISLVMMEISKGLISKLQTVQFSLNCSGLRENEMRSKLQDSLQRLSTQESAMQRLKASRSEADDLLVGQVNSLKSSLKEAEDRFALSDSETIALKEEVNSLEKRLRESDMELLTNQEKVVEAERRAENAETSCNLLAETNMELSKDLGSIRMVLSEKEDALDRQRKESDAQLKQATAAIEAIGEQRDLLFSTVSDMETLIKGLKARASEADAIAQSAESKCSSLTETNSKLSVELGSLRSRLGCLEGSLHQAEKAKMATAKDIGVKAKFINDLVIKLASERERLQAQVSRLTTDNQALRDSSQGIQDDGKELGCVESFEGSVAESSAADFQAEAYSPGVDDSAAAAGAAGAALNVGAVRSIEAGLLGPKHVVVAALVLAISAIGVYIFQLESCPF